MFKLFVGSLMLAAALSVTPTATRTVEMPKVAAAVNVQTSFDLPLPDPECKAMPRPDGSCPGGKKK